MSTQKLRAIYKQINDKIDNLNEDAVFEIKELKTDLNELQRHLSGRKKTTDIQPDDILRSAYEIAHYLRELRQRQAILDEMQDVAAAAEAEEYLLSRGAKLLTRPVGWHFQTAKERFLLHTEDAVKAAAELRKLLAAGKRLKRPKKKKAEPKAAVPKTAEAKVPAKETKEPAKKAKKGKPAKETPAQKHDAAAKKGTPVKKAKADKPAKAAASAKTAKTEPPAAKTKAKADKPAKAAKPKPSPKSKATGKQATPTNPKEPAKPTKTANAKKAATSKKKKTPAKK